MPGICQRLLNSKVTVQHTDTHTWPTAQLGPSKSSVLNISAGNPVRVPVREDQQSEEVLRQAKE